MVQSDSRLPDGLKAPLRRTWAGLLAERVLRCFWPLWSLVLAVLAALMLGVQDVLSAEVVWGIAVVVLLAALALLAYGIIRFRWPRRFEALARLDASLPGRPIRALLDRQGIGGEDAGSVALWQAHQARMARRAASAAAVRPDLRISARDPYGLRYLALLAFLVALLFGSLWRVSSVADLAPGGAALASGPAWEGWVEPPAYTGRPSLYLNDLQGRVEAPEGSRISLRFYGEPGFSGIRQSISRDDASAPADPMKRDLTLRQSGDLEVTGPGGRVWNFAMLADRAPQVEAAGPVKPDGEGRLQLPFHAQDDHGVQSGSATVTLDLAAVDRRYGLAIDPEPREDITVDLPMPLSGKREDFEETLIGDFSQHPWANLPVILHMQVSDALDQTGASGPLEMSLPGRRFFDPLAAAVIEQRRNLLWSRDNARLVAQQLRALSHRPEGLFRKETHYLRLRVALRRLEAMAEHGALSAARRDEVAAALWDLALALEDGDLSDARERMRLAQERLNEAIKNGANEAEIARLMQELRDATQDYMRQLAREQRQKGEPEDRQSAENRLQMNQDDLQRMMDRIQDLMEQGRMAEAQQALEEFQRMMENMRVTQGEGPGSPGQQALEGLSDTLRDQQSLSDRAFRDLQDRYNPGGQGRGEEGGEATEQSLAERQRALREELQRQREALPGTGDEQGEAAGEALDRAGRAMDGAEEALRRDDLAGAIEHQAEAMDDLREGMRNLGEALARDQRRNSGQQGQARDSAEGSRRDPLGRNPGSSGQLGSEENILQGQDPNRRARELLDEIRRRSGQETRPEPERDYLRRLLDRF